MSGKVEMAAANDVCLDIEQHLKDVLQSSCQNLIFSSNQGGKRRKNKAKAGNRSGTADQIDFLNGKEIVDFVPHSRNKIGDNDSPEKPKSNTTSVKNQNVSSLDQVLENKLSEPTTSCLPERQVENVQDGEDIHSLNINQKKSKNQMRKRGNRRAKDNTRMGLDENISSSDQILENDGISKSKTCDLPEQVEDFQESESSYSLNTDNKGARNKVNQRDYQENIVQKGGTRKEKKSFIYQDFEEQLASITPDLKELLESELMYPLNKPHFRFPKAVLLCRCCNFFSSLREYPKHIEKASHKEFKAIQEEDIFCRNLPRPSEAHCIELSNLLQDIFTEHGLSSSDLEKRQTVANRLTQLIQDSGLSKCELQVYGSSLTGFGLKDSDLNLDLTYSPSENLPAILCKLQPILKDCDELTDFGTEFQTKVPKIYFKDKSTKLNCVVTWGNHESVQTSRLLQLYRKLDPRVHILGVAFKYWARMCEIDFQDRGTLSSHAYIIMLIYFLQRVEQAVLPVLHEFIPHLDVDNPATEKKIMDKWKPLNKRTTGELWTELFRFYVTSFKVKTHIVCIRLKKAVLRVERRWEGSIIAIEDPSFQKRNLSRSISNFMTFCYIWDRMKSAYKYFAVPQTEEGPLFVRLNSKVLKDTREKATCDPALEINEVLSSLEEQETTEDEELEGGDEEEDDNDDKDDFRLGRRRRRRKRNTSSVSTEPYDFEDHSSSCEEDILEDHDPDISLDELKILENLDLGEDEESCSVPESSDANTLKATTERKTGVISPARKMTVADRLTEKGSCKKPEPSQSSEEPHKGSTHEPKLYFKFDKEILTDGLSPPMFCAVCAGEGHLQNDCSALSLPLLKELSPLSSSYLKQLDEACLQIMHKYAPDKKEVQARKGVIEELQEYIQITYEDACLELFGSSCNGFGFAGSDMDICLTFTDFKEELDHAEIISSLAAFFKGHQNLCNITAITSAKVPIVKFSYRNYDMSIECDISLYNTLAQHNTRMLLTYCKIDKRVQVLGYTMKHFVKLCDIGDASRGSLSSYAYILMVIYYLQQRKPAVLPVLQELYPKDQSRPEVIVDNWNAWFYDDLRNLETVWLEKGQNTESIGELWIGLLRFYTEEFDYKTHVVSIKQKAPLTRIEKFWNTRTICIEDPFDLNHNLGVGVSRKMSAYIMKAFIRGREIFGTSFEDMNVPHLMLYLFNQEKLSVGAPPNDRGCRSCGKIGHKVKDCPNRRNSRHFRRRKDEFQKDRRGRNARQRNNTREEAQPKAQSAEGPQPTRTRERRTRGPVIVKESKLMQDIIQCLKSNNEK